MKRVAIVGFGFMGATHARCVLENPGLELCGAVDSRGRDALNVPGRGNLDGAVHMQAIPGDLPVYRTLEDCVLEVKPDAVSVCVPLHLHFPMVKKALSLGLDVLVEKPFCDEPGQGSELIALAKERNLILMVAHCVRFSPEWSALASYAREGRYGRLRMLSMSRMAGVPTWGVWADSKVAATCGGALMDLLIHDIDFANSILGAPSRVEVNSRMDEFWDISLGYGEASPVVSVRGGFLHANSPFSSECVAVFDHASIRFGSLQPGRLHIGAQAGLETVDLSGDPYAAEIAYFSQCIEQRRPPLRCLPEESLLAIKTCTTIRNIANIPGDGLLVA